MTKPSYSLVLPFQNINLQVYLTIPAACLFIIVNPKLNHYYGQKQSTRLLGVTSHNRAVLTFTTVRTLIPVAKNTLFAAAVWKQMVI
jgi:hypothetical protein